MRRSLPALLLIASAALGCVAYHYPEGNVVGDAIIFPSGTYPRLVVGVEEPEVRIDATPLNGTGGPDAHTSARNIQQAVHTIDALRGTGLFSEVDFVKQLSRPPDRTIRIDPLPPRILHPATILPFLFTAGVIPWIHTEQTGVYFTVVNPPGASFHFDWPTTGLVGWAAPFLLFFPRWRLQQNPELLHASLAAYLVSRHADLWGQ